MELISIREPKNANFSEHLKMQEKNYREELFILGPNNKPRKLLAVGFPCRLYERDTFQFFHLTLLQFFYFFTCYIIINKIFYIISLIIILI